jgi:hypothetical protein
MATAAGSSVGAATVQEGRSVAQFVDRWIFVSMAGLFFLTVMAGFIPDSVGKIMALRAGLRPPFPAVLHFHAVLMGSWILLLLVQTTLMATGRSAVHKQLGLAGLFLAPAIVIVGSFVVPAMFHYNWTLVHSAPPGALPVPLEVAERFMSSLVAFQVAAGLLFSVFVAIALWARRHDVGMHKRLMILATAVPLPAAIDRIVWLPTTYPQSALSPVLYTVLWITPMLAWDLIRHKRLHKAYIIWFAIFIPVVIVAMNLWWTHGWVGTVERMMGVAT